MFFLASFKNNKPSLVGERQPSNGLLSPRTWKSVCVGHNSGHVCSAVYGGVRCMLKGYAMDTWDVQLSTKYGNVRHSTINGHRVLYL